MRRRLVVLAGLVALAVACGSGVSAGGRVPRCGDGVVDPGEGCDDGPGNGDSGVEPCRTDCAPVTCGDGFADPGEACDAGADNSDTRPGACRTTCTLPRCGDDVTDPGEACDDGPGNSATAPDACRPDCTAARCGDGVVDAGEGCDAGAANSDTLPDACRTSCAPARCGDGAVDAGEGCDTGAANSDTVPNACRTGCTPPRCGDGVTDAGEGCDEGAENGTPAAACGLDCTPVSCGNGVVEPGEECEPSIASAPCGPDCRWSVASTCGWARAPVIRAGAGTPIEPHGFLVPLDDRGASYDEPTGCTYANGADQFVAVPIPVPGDLLVTLELPPGEFIRPNVAVRVDCNDRTTELGCADDNAPYLLVRDLAPGVVYVQVDTDEGPNVAIGPFAARIELFPALGEGAACRPDGRTGRCEPAGGSLACVDPDLDGEGTCVPASGIDCGDAVGACAEGSWCRPTSPAAGECVVRCGDGRLDAEEECDDGNAVDGDGCSSACRTAGRNCADSIDLSARWDPGLRLASWEGDAGTFRPGPAAYVRFTAPVAGRYSFVAEATSGSFGVRHACDEPNAFAGASSPALDLPFGTEVSLAAGETVLLDARFWPAPFRLSAALPSCGDGVRMPSEECDDGNLVAGDGCSPGCVAAGDDCADPYPLRWDAARQRAEWEGVLAGSASGLAFFCEGAIDRPDVVARFVAPAAGRYQFTAEGSPRHALTLSVRPICADASSDRFCGKGTLFYGVPAIGALDLAAGEEVFAAIRGEGELFRLVVVPERCGDGIRTFAEECDDGNVEDGDGCDFGCRLERVEVEPDDTPATATPVELEELVRGDTAGSPDLFRFHALPSARYTIDLWGRRLGACDLVPRTLTLLGPDGAPIAEGLGGYGYWRENGACLEIDWTAPTGGDFFVAVDRPVAEVVAPYFLQVRSP